MSRRFLQIVLLGAMVACQGGDQTRPQGPYVPPSFLISDGTHSNGNPDFFWLPPMVNDPSGSPNFTVGKFNGTLFPTITICSLVGTQENQIGPNTPCSGNYFATSPSVEIPAPVVNFTNEFYQTSWTVPVSSDVFYRISAYVGSVLIGIADVHSVPSPSQLKSVNKNNFVGQQDGSNLPIKFRIEQAALCSPPGVYPCNSAGVDLPTGADVLVDTPNEINGKSGIHIPGQPNNNKKTTITVDDCVDMHTRGIVDIPTYGTCLTITADPPLTATDLAQNPATVFICDVGPALPSGMPPSQAERLTLHKLDIVGAQPPVVQALPHVAGCPQLAAKPSIGGLFRALAHRNWKRAGIEVLGLLGPREAYARRIDQGGGGTDVGDPPLSDFQFGLPAKMAINGGNNQTGGAGTPLPIPASVLVTDLGDLPVAGATVHFATSDGSVPPTPVPTDAFGIAQTSWTLGGTLGSQSMTASGYGIGGDDPNNGPRNGVDPFQPCPYGGPLPSPETCPGGASGPVLLQTGTRTFSATAIIPFGATGYSYKQVASTSTSPTGWQQLDPPFDELGNDFSQNRTAPFASNGNPCFYAAASPWLKKTDILIRKTFTLKGPSSVQVRTAMDRDIVEIWLNGVLMTGGPTSNNGCAVLDATSNGIFTGNNGVAGSNLLAIRASARSTSAFLDVKVTVP